MVFEELALSTYGNRLPQLSFEVFRPLADPDTAEGLTQAVTMIPASGEFTYATQAIRKTDGGATVPENLNALADSTDMVEALDRLQAMAPAVESVSLVVAWFGDEARRITVDTTRIASESFPMAVPPEEAERRCRRALMEAWVGRETAAFRLPPSRLALDPADPIRLAHDGRLVDLRLVSIADAEAHRGTVLFRAQQLAF